ncbi:MAG: hypothetical protein AUJ52_02020 [Elusimicrobia bacterium CG1_02_63_36]|nr:MAG: hypothetical protein AUJ52_02020 [Elusimicrobia bacterium CG1_02_63_36]PIP83513.1 MAG: hypothetical protein COR54_09140 [Elusimicrobia bacterium CG22_combo_CG10-13_8_21_14_all_63_91]PJA14326.1 MAG: hypothetical protein COX66_12730 [Elusimicrobia bacterium CG_4_10_14_0_2_um_filter_63_34]PJB23296.1 MAG: hypothetical protein CO113_18605 [Elusimicrobia bacterium CG_4_9_14_3_um_filter_62_55]
MSTNGFFVLAIKLPNIESELDSSFGISVTLACLTEDSLTNDGVIKYAVLAKVVFLAGIRDALETLSTHTMRP